MNEYNFEIEDCLYVTYVTDTKEEAISLFKQDFPDKSINIVDLDPKEWVPFDKILENYEAN